MGPPGIPTGQRARPQRTPEEPKTGAHKKSRIREIWAHLSPSSTKVGSVQFEIRNPAAAAGAGMTIDYIARGQFVEGCEQGAQGHIHVVAVRVHALPLSHVVAPVHEVTLVVG